MASLNFGSLALILFIALVVLIIIALYNSSALTENNGAAITPVGDPVYVYQAPESLPCVESSLDFVGTQFESDGNVDPTNYFWDGGVQLLGANAGKIVAIGRSYITRYNEDGTRDLSFGTNGWVDISAIESVVTGSNALAIDLQDRIYIASRSNETNQNHTITRILPDGAADTSFSGNGVTDLENSLFDGSSRGSFDIMITPDGGIYGLGLEGYLFKLLDNGNLDTSFGTNGVVQIVWSSNPSLNLYTWHMDYYQGQIYIGCHDQNISVGAARYNFDGSKDTTYGGGSDPVLSSTDVTAACNDTFETYGCGVGPDGSFYISSTVVNDQFSSCGDYNLAMVKFDPSGQLDTTFGNRNGVYVDDRPSVYNANGDYSENYHRISFDACTGNMILTVNYYRGDGPNDVSYILQLTPVGVPIPNPSELVIDTISETYYWSGVTHPNGRFYAIGEGYDIPNGSYQTKIVDFEAPGYAYAAQDRPW